MLLLEESGRGNDLALTGEITATCCANIYYIEPLFPGFSLSIMKIAGTLGFRGIGVYPTFFHLDIREVKNFGVSNGKNESQNRPRIAV